MDSYIPDGGRITETAEMPAHIRDIAPIRNDENTEDTCFADFEHEVEELGEGRFLMKHENDSSQNVTVSIEVWEEDMFVDWNGMSASCVSFITSEHGFDVQKNQPDFCLRSLIQHHHNLVFGLRPFEEIEKNVK